MKMLVIDDSKAMRGFLTALAKDFSFDTQEAEDGRAGLDTLIKTDPREPFDIVLVDWDMPRMNGFEFVQFVRKNHDYDGMKIMMVTTNNTAEKIGMALEAGANDFLMKPVTREALEEKLMILGLVA
jgi:two-component system, chemotaxis family, chemotaxis protein CheY